MLSLLIDDLATEPHSYSTSLQFRQKKHIIGAEDRHLLQVKIMLRQKASSKMSHKYHKRERERERERGHLTQGPDENRKLKENLSLNLRLLRFLPKIIIKRKKYAIYVYRRGPFIHN
jgi:vacuolar-type H+-ATPase subunit B/Vma2